MDRGLRQPRMYAAAFPRPSLIFMIAEDALSRTPPVAAPRPGKSSFKAAELSALSRSVGDCYQVCAEYLAISFMSINRAYPSAPSV